MNSCCDWSKDDNGSGDCGLCGGDGGTWGDSDAYLKKKKIGHEVCKLWWWFC